MPQATASCLLEVCDASKHYLGVQALDRASLRLDRGEVLAVIGENGAGKSTLIKILSGVEQPDGGEIRLDGAPVRMESARMAVQLGIATIFQELSLCDNLDIGANIFLGREPHRAGFVDRDRIRRESQAVLQRIGLNISPAVRVGALSAGQRQMVEIARALSVKARVLIMDEPSSSLSQAETEQLFRVVRELKASGVSILYVSHRLGEVKAIADRVVALRDGRNAGQLDREEIEHDRMVRLMVGRDATQFYRHEPHPPGELVLEADNLRVPAFPGASLTFVVRGGEIVGLTGLVGSGRTELLQTLFGVTPALGGTIRVAGQPIRMKSPQAAIHAGVSLVPEDRQHLGLILQMAIRENLSLPSLRRQQHAGLLDRAREKTLGTEMIGRLGIKATGDRQIAETLSGGNQQKVVLGKWLATEPRLFLLDEPTRGIDVGAKEEIYRLMEQLARRGVATLMASSDMEEILGMSDRVLVMHEGRIAGELPRSQLDEEVIMSLATGHGLAEARERV
jgi:ribose transport system ATP-binding protein